jgi:hypothetical protein
MAWVGLDRKIIVRRVPEKDARHGRSSGILPAVGAFHRQLSKWIR